MTELKRRFNIKTCWPWILLILATLFFAFRYLPAACESIVTSDVLTLVIFYRDIVVQGHSAHGWVWGGASFEFPDMAVVWALNFLLGDGITAMATGAGLFFVLWVAGVVWVYKAAGGRQPGVFASLTLLFAVILAHSHGILGNDGLVTFMPVFHAGAVIMSLACLAITLKIRQQGYRPIFWLMSLLLILGASSDPVFLVVCTAPVLCALAVAALVSKQIRRIDLLLVCNIALSSVAGILLRPVLFPAHISSGYTRLNLPGAKNSLHVIREAMQTPGHMGFAVLVVLDILFVLFAMAMLIPFAPWNRKRLLRGPLLFILAYAASCVAMNWGAAILTGNYADMSNLRYVTFSLALPPLMFAALVAGSMPWGKKSITVLTFAVTIFTVAAAISLPPVSSNIRDAQLEISTLRKIMAQEHIEAGLGDYWSSHMLTYMSGGAVKTAAITSDGNPYRWFNNIQDYTGYDKTQAPPAFRFIYLAGLDPAGIRAHYGEPSKILSTPDRTDIWIYSPVHAIHYSAAFNCMGNDSNFIDVNTFHIAASALPSITGKKEGDSIIALAGRDQQNTMIYGPYLHVAPGRYKIDFTYVCETPAEPGKGSAYDCIITTPQKQIILDQAPLPYVKGALGTFTREVTVPELKFPASQCALETRIIYKGSGDLRIDSLTITRLDTP
ncbi:MAG: hypothetical protein WCD79_22920 [Chthoniobacteraceae bacterium]